MSEKDPKEYWKEFFVSSKISDHEASTYAEYFIFHDYRIDTLKLLEKSDLKEMGIVKIGHIKLILQHANEVAQQNDPGSTKSSIAIEIRDLLRDLKDADIAETFELTNVLKKTQHKLHKRNVETGFGFFGEAASAILNAYAGKRKAVDESGNSKPQIKKKAPNHFLDKPELSDYIFPQDFIDEQDGHRPKQEDLDTTLLNGRAVRNGLDHEASQVTQGPERSV